jgi:hypothetical protein
MATAADKYKNKATPSKKSGKPVMVQPKSPKSGEKKKSSGIKLSGRPKALSSDEAFVQDLSGDEGEGDQGEGEGEDGMRVQAWDSLQDSGHAASEHEKSGLHQAAHPGQEWQAKTENSAKAASLYSRISRVYDGALRARPHPRFVPPPIQFILDSLIYSVPLFLKRQCDRTLGVLLFAVVGCVLMVVEVEPRATPHCRCRKAVLQRLRVLGKVV